MTKKNQQLQDLENENAALQGVMAGICAQLGITTRSKSPTVIGRAIRKAIDDLKDAAPDTPAPGALGTEPPHTFDDLVDQQIERFGDEASLPAGALAKRPEPGAKAHVISQIWRELGIPGDTMSEEQILAAIRNMKNAGGDVEAEATPGTATSHSLVDVVAQGRQLEHGLRDELTRARGIISRVAGALQVSQWDADGTELVERAQRVEKAKHELRKLISSCRTGESTQPPIVAALATVLGILSSPAAAAKFLENKPAAVRAMEVAPTPDLGRFKPFLASSLRDIWHATESIADGNIRRVFGAMDEAGGVGADFVTFMNLVIIPRLAILGMPATRGSAD